MNDESIIHSDDKDILLETTPEGRKQQLLEQINKRKASTKAVAKSAVSIYDNLDAWLGAIEKIFLVVLAEFVRTGNWVSAICFSLLFLTAWILKIRRPVGPVMATLKLEPKVLRAKLVSLTKTYYT